MGIFSQDKTTTNQTAYNQQTAVSNRDLSGSQVTAGAGARIVYTSLDEKALQTAAATVNNALAANTAQSQSSLQGFQNALSVVAEHQQSAADLATGQQQSLLGQVGLTSQQIYIGLGLAAAVVIFLALRKGR